MLDVYPLEAPDPLLQLIQKNEILNGGTEEKKPEQAPEIKVEKPRQGKPVVDRLVTITLDPGHGGEDPGAVGRGGSQEKHVTLAVAKRLKAKIDAEPNMRAVLTRDTDFFRAASYARAESAAHPVRIFLSRSTPMPLRDRTPTAHRFSRFQKVAHPARQRAIWRRKKTRQT